MTEIRGPIKGAVAGILNARELVINRGLSDGLRVGMKFAVLDPRTVAIKDPETGQDLGSVYRPKVRVRVVQVELKLAVASTYEIARSGGGFGRLSGVAALFAPSEPQVVSLRKGAGQWEELTEEESYVKIGDPVEQIIETSESAPAVETGDGAEQSNPHD